MFYVLSEGCKAVIFEYFRNNHVFLDNLKQMIIFYFNDVYLILAFYPTKAQNIRLDHYYCDHG